MTTCAICVLPFEATTSYGLCSSCITPTTLKEFDKLESAIHHARHEGVRATLSLPDWLAALSDFNGKCGYCMHNFAHHIDRVDANKGLDKGNVVPICGACQVHKAKTWKHAEARVSAYLVGHVTFRVEGLEWEEHLQEVTR